MFGKHSLLSKIITEPTTCNGYIVTLGVWMLHNIQCFSIIIYIISRKNPESNWLQNLSFDLSFLLMSIHYSLLLTFEAQGAQDTIWGPSK